MILGMTTPAATSPIPIPQVSLEDPNPPIPQDSQDAGILSNVTRPIYRVIDSVKTYIANQFDAETAKNVSEIAQKIMQWIRENILFWCYSPEEKRIRELNKQRDNLQDLFCNYYTVVDSFPTKECEENRKIVETFLNKEIDPELFFELKHELYDFFKKYRPEWTDKYRTEKCKIYLKEKLFYLMSTGEGKKSPVLAAIINLQSTRFRKHHIID